MPLLTMDGVERVDDDDTLRKRWLAERLTGIGSSDAPAIAGVSPWRTPVEVWLEKTQALAPREDEDTGPTYWGKRLEPLILDEYRARTGFAIGHQQQLIRSKQHSFMLATVDAIAVPTIGGPRPVEAKTARFAREWGAPETDEAPLPYIIQVQHQLSVTGYDAADIAVLIGGSDFRIYNVPRDEAIIARLIEEEEKFWRCVETRKPPPIKTTSDAELLYPKHTAGLHSEADEPTYNAWLALREATRLADIAKDEQERLRAIIQAHMQRAEMLVYEGDVLATWRTTAPVRRVDSKKLEREHPTIYASVLKPNEGERRFLLKEGK